MPTASTVPTSASQRGRRPYGATSGVVLASACGVSRHTGTVPSGPLAVIAPRATPYYHGGSRATGRAYDGERILLPARVDLMPCQDAG